MKIIFCIPGKSYSINFLTSLLAVIDYCYKNNIFWAVSLAYSNNLYRSRNICLHSKFGEIFQKPFDGFEYDKLVWIDSDVVFTQENFEKLISHDLDIVSGLYVLEDQIHYACGFFRTEKEMIEKGADVSCLQKSDITNNSLIEVDWIGLGFAAFKYGVFEKLKYPYFEPQFFKIGEYSDFYNDDTSLCKKLKELGYKIYVDPTIKVGHEKNIILY